MKIIQHIFYQLVIVFTCIFTTKIFAECADGTVFCGEGLKGGLNTAKENLNNSGVATAESIIDVILGIIDFSLPFAGVLAFVSLIYGGFLYLNPVDEENKGKDIIIYSVVGLVIIFMAYPLVSTIIAFRS